MGFPKPGLPDIGGVVDVLTGGKKSYPGTGAKKEPEVNEVFTPGGGGTSGTVKTPSQGPVPQNQLNTSPIGPQWLRDMIAQRDPSGQMLGAQSPALLGTNYETNAAGLSPYYDPLAIQLFYQQAIAPMMNQLQTNLGQQNAQFTQMAQANLDKRQLPAEFRAIFGESLPRQAAQQNNVVASLMAAQEAGPALEQMMGGVNRQSQLMNKLYQQALVDQMLGEATSFGLAGTGGLPADVLPKTG